MKKVILTTATLITLFCTSCTIHTHVVGSGAKGSEVIEKRSVYLLGNRLGEADTKAMAAGATDYTIDTRTNLLDMVFNGITFGLISTRTVRVKK